MDGLVQIQVVVQGNVGAVGLVGLDAQGRVWYGELSGAKHPLATPSSGQGSKSVRSPTVVMEVNPMTRLGRRASVLIAFCMLASTATAHAETGQP